MTYRLLITLLNIILALHANAQDEVEFSVKKADLPDVHVYNYTDVVAENLYNSFAAISVSQYKRDYTYHSLYKLQQEKASGERSVQIHYKHSGDTTYAGTINNGNTVYTPMFVRNNVIAEPYLLFPTLVPFPNKESSKLYYINDTASVKVGDTVFTCIKLVETTPVQRSYFLVHIKRIKLFKKKEKTNAIRVFYLHKENYLPIIIATASDVANYTPQSILNKERVLWRVAEAK